jgi:folate-binding protein YgfZ
MSDGKCDLWPVGGIDPSGRTRQVWVVDLSSRVLLALKGVDRVRYLNGQVTSNVAKLGVGSGQSACVTTAKGRLCAEVHITAVLDALWVDADPLLAEDLPGRLERYMVADDVTLEALEGKRLLHWMGGQPSGGEAAQIVPSVRYGVLGWDLWLEPGFQGDPLTAFWAGDCGSEGVPCARWMDAEALEVMRVERGIPRWGFELGEDTLPPEAGLDLTHVDYHKGCYVGQEVISRLKSVGHVNRHLVGFAASGVGTLKKGMEVWSAAEGSRPVGKVTSVAWSFALEKTLGLGYLKRGVSGEGLVARSPEMPNIEIPITLREFLKSP